MNIIIPGIKRFFEKRNICKEVRNISIDKGKEIKIKIGEVVFLVKTDNDTLETLIYKRFDPFLCRKEVPDIFIEVQIKGWIPTKDFGELEITSINGEVLFIHSHYAGLVNLHEKKGKLVLRTITVSSIETFLRICSSYFVSDFNGLVLHAATVENDGKGFIFCGKSECGKSTIARLSEKYLVFTDEISIIRRIGNIYKVFSTPFWGEMQGGIADVNSSVKVETILFPRKSKEVYLEKVNSSNALLEIMKNTLFFTNDNIRAQKIFELCHGIAEEIPCYELYFLPDASFWECILDEKQREGGVS